MSKKIRDILILTLIGLILYGLVYYNFVLVDAMAQVKDVNAKIETAEKERQALEDDLKNLPNLQRNLEMKNVQNKRLEEYLMSEANLADNIEYIDKLAKLFKSNFSKINIGKPIENSSDATKSKYYEFAIETDTIMNYTDAMNLINYIEGGSRKVKLTVFKLTPNTPSNVAGNVAPPQNTQTVPNQQSKELTYTINMKINMYSLNLSNLDKVYEYSRKRFDRFDYGDGVIFVPTTGGTSTAAGSSTVSANTVGTNNVTTNTSSASGSTIQQNVAKRSDIEIKLISFLYAGQNFTVRGNGARAPIMIRSNERPSVKITFSGNAYDVSVVDSIGKTYSINGKTENERISMYVSAYFPLEIKENQKLGADIQIINNSSKNIDLNFEDKVSRLKITDRNGNTISNQSESEKVYII
ncbi:hypothetical protein [Acetivibrio cellulolyticus]|uniref:hypothetical protein n=1 Tax=Acetivibrio cellulolyticus TaxID=35830 RepID=UPI0001E2C6F3|nr:hypothetical protein [Acetivibrio cellulolyticus]